jgi:hypothetical protein
MAKVKVYFYKGSDIRTDESIISQRRATIDFIKLHHYEALMDTELEVDDSALDENYHYPKKEGQS